MDIIHTIGEITLDISTIIYFIWFIPQLKLTFTRGSTSGLSMLMHGLLVAGYLADLIYGFGRHLPIQYRLVTIFGLFFLAIEHYQFWHYGLKAGTEKILYFLLSIFFIIFFTVSILLITIHKESKFFYDMAGMVSNFCWFTFFIPQIIKNYIRKSTEGLSVAFVVLSMVGAVCDAISTYALNYAWPSKFYMPTVFFKKMIVLGQCFYYRKNPEVRLAFE